MTKSGSGAGTGSNSGNSTSRKRARIDQSAHHRRRRIGFLRQSRDAARQSVARDLKHARPRRRHARGRCALPVTYAMRGTSGSKAARAAQRHGQNHAWRTQRVTRHPIDEIAQSGRKCGIIFQRHGFFQSVVADLAFAFAPNHAQRLARAERRDNQRSRVADRLRSSGNRRRQRAAKAATRPRALVLWRRASPGFKTGSFMATLSRRDSGRSIART